MLTRKIDAFLKHFYESSSKSLLVTGARQIGKTFSIREFGKSFDSFVEINFIESPDAVNVFANAVDSSDLLLKLSAFIREPLIPGKTLIFFDEVQECPEIVTAIKFLVDEGNYRYILSGSLLGVELKDLRSVPVGYMDIKEMYPLDLEEFLINVGLGANVIDAIRTSWETRTPTDDVLHKKLMELFRLYLIVGGMPAAVSAYISTNNLQRVMEEQQTIIRLYRKDIAKYDPENKLYIDEIFNLIPSELNAKNKRFILKNLNEHMKFSRHENGFIWLREAGVALPVYNIDEPKTPVVLSKSRNLFKLFQSDIGLLASQYADNIQLRILSGDRDLNFGGIFENFVAQELKAHGFDLYYYNNKKKGELDFVIEYYGKVLPIEVKSGKDYERHRALSNIMDCTEYGLQQAIVFGNDNLKSEGKILYAPIYMLMFLQQKITAPTYYKIDLRGIE